MEVNVLVKSIADGRNGLAPCRYDYPPQIHSGNDLIRETVKICLHRYRERMAGGGQTKTLSLKEQAASGKVVYGLYSNRKPPDEAEAVQNALEAFEDGTIAVFVDGKELESLTEKIELRDGSEAVFLKLTALSASCMLLDWMC